MVRHGIALGVCALMLASCGPGGLATNGPAPNSRPMNLVADLLAPSPPGQAQVFSYSHSWMLDMSHDAVAPRFERARDFCLHDKTLNCRLVSANLSSGGSARYSYEQATLQVLLPHDRLDVFEKALRKPLGAEKPDDVEMTSRSTQAQSVETEAGDAGRKVEQLTAYRDRLAALAGRPNLSIDDVIRLEAEQARVQGELDDAAAHKRDLTDGIARESVTVQLSERTAATGPFTQVLSEAGTTFTDNAASALRFVIAAVPWLPIVAAGLFLVSWLWRLFRRRREKAA